MSISMNQYIADSRVLVKMLEAITREIEPSHSDHVYAWRLQRHRLNYANVPIGILRHWGRHL